MKTCDSAGCSRPATDEGICAEHIEASERAIVALANAETPRHSEE